MSTDMLPTPTTEYQWSMYPADVLHYVMTDQVIGPLAGALSAYTAEELIIPLEVMSRNSNISTPVDYTTGGHTRHYRQQHLQKSGEMVKHITSQPQSLYGSQQERDSDSPISWYSSVKEDNIS
jgi:hypothetical protein